tara:strand:- start:3255 stop:3860 length:606 start_codon:yes stop_codon:yes gene_type:complete
MLLFLDLISPISEFSIIEDNKLILNKKITNVSNDKLSDCIFQIYQEIEKEINITKYLKKIVLTIGPGSYTNLRVGSAFALGLKISLKIPIYPFSINDLVTIKKLNLDENNAFYIYSANQQKFLCELNSNKDITYTKIDNDKFILPEQVDKLYYNYKKINSKSVIQIKFSMLEELLQNNKYLIFNKNEIIKPIYISNNEVLN